LIIDSTRWTRSSVFVMSPATVAAVPGDFPEANQHIGEDAIGVHGDVSGDIVEDVRFGEIVDCVQVADRDCGRERPRPQAVEEHVSRYVSADSPGGESAERLEELIDFSEPRNALRIEGQALDTFHEFRVRVLFPAWHDPGIQSPPRFLVVIAVQVVGLLDVELAIVAGLLDECGLGRGESLRRHVTDLLCG
jgi:hypothetical protein